jgi:AcrR family transcriptional regulator
MRRILVDDLPVKRRYDAEQRRRRAAERRMRVVQAARGLFAERGFSRTTVAAVASEAGVSPETVYKAFGGKAGLVRSIWQDALAGAGPGHAERRSDAIAASASSGLQIIEGWLRVALEVAPRAAAVLTLVRSAAAVDPEAAELLDEIERGRTERMLHNARALEAGGHLRSDLSAAQAAELLLIFSGEFYERLVLRAGWDVETYVAAMTRTMAAALLRKP